MCSWNAWSNHASWRLLAWRTRRRKPSWKHTKCWPKKMRLSTAGNAVPSWFSMVRRSMCFAAAVHTKNVTGQDFMIPDMLTLRLHRKAALDGTSKTTPCCYGWPTHWGASFQWMDHDEHIVAAEKRVGRYMRRMRLALAYAEIKNAKSTTFHSEITEMDSGRMGSKKESNSNPRMKEHQGRTLVLKGRVSKKWVAFALRTTMSKKGRGMGTEKIDEVRAPLRDSLGAGTVIAADGAKTWQSIAKEIKKPILRGISHQKKIFCNVDRMKKRDLSKAEARTMTTAASSSSAQEGVNHFWAAAGDNAAEGLLGHIKGSMRRQNLVGQGAHSKSELSNVAPVPRHRHGSWCPCCLPQGCGIRTQQD